MNRAFIALILPITVAFGMPGGTIKQPPASLPRETASIIPGCSIVLYEAGTTTPALTVAAGTFFDIFVGNSSHLLGMRSVRFFSDNNQNGIPTGEGTWTDSFDWEQSSGAWTASTKRMSWSFSNEGNKEVWAEVTGHNMQTQTCRALITAETPPLAVTLSATPSSGPAPLNVLLAAQVTGSAGGSTNYSFWYNCASTTTNPAQAATECGALPAPAVGMCSQNQNGYKCEAVHSDAESVSRTYTSSGTATAKVIVERSSAAPAESRASITATNDPPALSSEGAEVAILENAECISGVIFSWTSSDPNESTLTYRLEVSNNGSFSDLQFDSGDISISTGPTTRSVSIAASPVSELDDGIANGSGQLSFQQPYWWRVTVTDSAGASDSYEGPSFDTPLHAAPSVNFSWIPVNPSIGELVSFTDTTIAHGGATIATWNWSFQDADPSSSAEQNPITTFQSSGGKEVTLTATDSDGISCTESKTPPAGLQVNLPLPDVKEVEPSALLLKPVLWLWDFITERFLTIF